MGDQLKLPEVARRLGVSEKTARRYVKSGALPSVFIGNSYRVSEEDLEKFIEESRVTASSDLGKAPRRSSLEPSLDDVLEDLRRTTERFQNYHEIQKAMDEYRELWERRLSDEDLDKTAFEEAGRALSAFWPAVAAAADSEMGELKRHGYSLEEAKAESVLLPAIARFQALGDRVNRTYREKFQTVPASNVYAFPQRKAS